MDKKPEIRTYYKPEGKELEALRWAYKRYQDMRESPDRHEAEKNWDKWEKQWEAHRSVRNAKEWQSTHYVPLPTSIIEPALAEIVDQTPQPLILPRGAEDQPKT